MFSLFKIKAVSNKSHKILDIAKIMQMKTQMTIFLNFFFLFVRRFNKYSSLKKQGFYRVTVTTRSYLTLSMACFCMQCIASV